MSRDDDGRHPSTADPRSRGAHEAPRAWAAPSLEPLPPLTELTLQTGGEIPGDGDTGTGSTVF